MVGLWYGLIISVFLASWLFSFWGLVSVIQMWTAFIDYYKRDIIKMQLT